MHQAIPAAGLQIWTVWEIQGSAYIGQILEAYFDRRGMWPAETVETAR